ncbi:MAG: preprotein translocase subunit SecE [Microgenomates group bacterium]
MVRLTTYVREVIRELKKVTWPTYEQTQNKTLLVIGVSIAVGLYIGVLDFLLNWLVTTFL